LANLISNPPCQSLWHLPPCPSPAPPALITHPLLGLGGSGGGRLALPRRRQGLWGPSWHQGSQLALLAGRRWAQLSGEGEQASRAGQNVGARQLPTCTLPGVQHQAGETGRRVHPPTRSHDLSLQGPRNTWELLARPVPTPLCRPAGSEVTGSHAPAFHLFPRGPPAPLT
jgi:hypothetical protein